MKYVVKCPYCGHSYIIDESKDEKDFQCDNCGGQNSTDDVVERINEPVIVKPVIRKVYVKEDKEKSIQAIKNFDVSAYTEDESIGADREKNKGINLFIIILLILVGLMLFLSTYDDVNEMTGMQGQVQSGKQEREDEVKNSSVAREAEAVIEQWMTAMNNRDLSALISFYHIPTGSFYSEDDLREMINNSKLEELWGTDVKINSITFMDYSEKYEPGNRTSLYEEVVAIKYKVDFSNDYSKIFVVKINENGEIKIKPEEDNVATDVVIKTALKGSSVTESVDLFIDDMLVQQIYTEIESEEGYMYGQYTIPLIAKGEHSFKISTSLGDLAMPYEVEKSNQVIELDALQVKEELRNEMAVYLQDAWNQVQVSALNYAEPVEFRAFLGENISDEEIEDLAKQIRMLQGLRGDYEAAYITDIKVTDTHFYALNYNTFIIPVIVTYQSAGVDYASGTCNSQIAITVSKDGWQIHDIYDGRFFTLIEQEQPILDN